MNITDDLLQKLLINVAHAVESEAVLIAPKVSGNLAGDIQVFDEALHLLRVSVGNSSLVPYAPFVHGGTGLYGPNQKRITPRTKKALKTPYGPRKSIAGQKAQPYLADAMEHVLDSGVVDRIIDDLGDDAVNAIRDELKKALRGTPHIAIT